MALDNPTNKYIQIHSSIVQDVLGRDYCKIIKALVKGEYILCNEYSSEYLGICKSFAIHPRLMDVSKPVLRIDFNYDTVLHNKLERIGTLNLTKPADKDNPTPLDEGRQHIIAMTNQLILVPDAEATAYVQALYDESGNTNSPAAYFHHWNTNPMRQPHMDLFGRRMHSNITNMPKVLRRCLRFKSAPEVPTVEKDIVNAQPFFLSVINANLINLFAPECSSAVAVYAKYRAKPDYVEFTELCSSGWIYESFIERYYKVYGERYGSTDKETRQITKGLIYTIFFGDYSLIMEGLKATSRAKLTELKKKFFILFTLEFKSVYEIFK
ncbi:hypothetical protein KBK19_14165 [Microvirga sp. STR05]|uniref:Uncharacterized protein n=1 Tax=Hymenobacter duratus TaxID=2771356 RepID=A0ABR8JH53_9BACT|nr:hypothetical protein [Hymenobacter duratus]MBD2716183.1 hypothetical protein [Hymenobacter duratus]MBR7951097.1 hypothetical protein [Microvirga sp. STR05]